MGLQKLKRDAPWHWTLGVTVFWAALSVTVLAGVCYDAIETILTGGTPYPTLPLYPTLFAHQQPVYGKMGLLS